MVKFILNQYECKSNRKVTKRDDDLNKGWLEVYCLPNYKEHIFRRTRTLQEKQLQQDLYRDWHVNTSAFCQEDWTPSLVLFDQATAG